MLFHNAYETFLEIYCNYKGKIIEWCLYIHTFIYDNMITVLPTDETMNYVSFDKHFNTCISTENRFHLIKMNLRMHRLFGHEISVASLPDSSYKIQHMIHY